MPPIERFRFILLPLAAAIFLTLIGDLVRLATDSTAEGKVPWVRVAWGLGVFVAAWAARTGRRWAADVFLGALALSLVTFVPVLAAEWARPSSSLAHRLATLACVAVIGWVAKTGWRARRALRGAT